MNIEFRLPDLGESVESADVVNVSVAEGHVVQPDQNVMELETDKAMVELPCPHKGRVVKVHVRPGQTVKVGDLLLTLEGEEAPAAKAVEPAVPAEAPEAEEPKVEPLVAAEEKPTPPPAASAESETPPVQPVSLVHAVHSVHPVQSSATPERRPAPASPSTRRLARELGVDLHQVSGTGPGGRITDEDVQAYVRKIAAGAMSGAMAAGTAAPPLPDFSQWGPVERVPLSGIRRKTAENVSLSARIVVHVTQHDETDITDLETARKRYQEGRAEAPGKITMTALAIKAVVAGLRAYPQFRSSIDPAVGVLIRKDYYHIGVAVDTEHGLVVPVLRDANRKSVRQIASELEEIAGRARERRISVEEMRGGVFTITNLGGIGGGHFTPIVNYPEVAILGMGRARQEPRVVDGAVAIRLVLPLSLSYDHRAIDGADAARFLRHLAQLFGDPMRLMLEG